MLRKLFLLLALMPLIAAAQEPEMPKDKWLPKDGYFVHDPVMARGEDGKYYLFCTGKGISVMSSTDMKEWTKEQPVFPSEPKWAKKLIKGFKKYIWAPDITFHNGLWYLYYSCSTGGKNGSAIGLAVNKTLDPTSPDFKWEDRGLVIASRRHVDCWNAIDPNLAFDQEGKPYLVFGSFWDGIQLIELAADLQTPITEPRTIARRRNHHYTIEEVDDPETFDIEGNRTNEAGDNAIEAPFIIYHDSYYYLFVSHDYCCHGRNSNYRTVYGRSTSIEGPYIDRDGVRMDEGGGTLLYGPCDEYAGIGHNAAYNIDGQWLFISHAYDRSLNGCPVLFTRKMSFTDDGWIVGEP